MAIKLVEHYIKEAANPENAELNAKILSVLQTRGTQNPKYREELEALGFELVGGEGSWSSYGNWMLIGPNGRKLVISEGRDSVPGLYDAVSRKAMNDAYDKFDYVNYFNVDRAGWSYKEPSTVDAFKDAKSKISRNAMRKVDYIAKIAEMQSAIQELSRNDRLEDILSKDELDNAHKVLNSIRQRLSK